MEDAPLLVDKSIARKRAYTENESKIKLKDGVPLFTIVELNIWGSCNRNCPFCPVSDPGVYTNKSEGITLELYCKILQDLQELDYGGTILFSAFSEPMLNKDLPELVKLTKKALPNVHLEINTNGDIVKSKPKKLMELYECGVDSVIFSVYDGEEAHNWFEQLRQEKDISPDQFVIRRRYFSKTDNDYGIIFSNRSGSANVARFLNQDEQIEESLPLLRKCFYPFYQVLIDYNGDMLICPHDWGKKFIVGNLTKSNIWELWASDDFTRVRTRLAHKDRNFLPCRACNVKGDYIGKPNYEAWQISD